MNDERTWLGCTRKTTVGSNDAEIFAGDIVLINKEGAHAIIRGQLSRSSRRRWERDRSDWPNPFDLSSVDDRAKWLVDVRRARESRRS